MSLIPGVSSGPVYLVVFALDSFLLRRGQGGVGMTRFTDGEGVGTDLGREAPPMAAAEMSAASAKDFYLGTGSGPDDRESYRRALGKWKVIEAELDALKAAETLQQKYAKWGEMLAARQGTNGKPDTTPLPQPCPLGDKLHPSLERWLEGRARHGGGRPTTPPKPKAKTMGKHIDDYIAEQKGRYEYGLKFPNCRSTNASARRGSSPIARPPRR